ncbi:MAG: transporter substrate-binding protein [Massilia sp.]|jgi:protein TonB|nr:transporter substrate-binding protein [Massilia sp.]
MHFSHMNDGKGNKFTKIAIVAALHVAVGAALVHSMNSKLIKMPKLPEDMIVMFTPVPPPPPPEPAKPMPKVAPPQVVAPKVEVEVQQTPPPDAVAATTIPDPTPAEPAPAHAEAPPAPSAAKAGNMYTAVLADANGCAKPDYPTRAARNGETGTVTLALLVGTDGRVRDSKVQKSSGSRELDKAAISALSLCKFKPATNGGVAEPAWGQIAYVWTLEQ